MPTYCTLQDAFGISSFNKKENKPQPTQQANNNPNDSSKNLYPDSVGVKEGLRSVCPHCNSCLNQNNEFQQRVVNTALGPLPRWIPQNHDGVGAWDPFNRYFPQAREDFGNVGMGREDFGNLSVGNAEKLIQLIMYLLIALFVIQLLEFVVGMTQTSQS